MKGQCVNDYGTVMKEVFPDLELVDDAGMRPFVYGYRQRKWHFGPQATAMNGYANILVNFHHSKIYVIVLPVTGISGGVVLSDLQSYLETPAGTNYAKKQFPHRIAVAQRCSLRPVRVHVYSICVRSHREGSSGPARVQLILTLKYNHVYQHITNTQTRHY